MNVLITGATGGIGVELARVFYDNGDQILLHGRNQARLEKLAGSLSSNGERVRWISADLNIPADRLRIVAAAVDFSVDTLVNNAGVNEFSAFTAASVEDIVQTNVIGTMLITQALLPNLLAQVQPKIINLGSTFGAIGYPGYVSYCAAKHAIKGFTEGLKREFSDSALNVLYISPRATATGMNSRAATKMNDELNVTCDPPRIVAGRILNAIQRNERRVQIGLPEWIQTKLNALFPSLVDIAIGKQLPRIKHHLEQELMK